MSFVATLAYAPTRWAGAEWWQCVCLSELGGCGAPEAAVRRIATRRAARPLDNAGADFGCLKMQQKLPQGFQVFPDGKLGLNLTHSRRRRCYSPRSTSTRT